MALELNKKKGSPGEESARKRRIELAKVKKKRATSAPHIFGKGKERRQRIKLGRQGVREARKRDSESES